MCYNNFIITSVEIDFLRFIYKYKIVRKNIIKILNLLIEYQSVFIIK